MKRNYTSKHSAAKALLLVTIITLCFISHTTFAATFNGATVNSAQTICSGATPTALSLTINQCISSTSYSITAYQWQSSANGSTLWTNISGATALTYSPPALTATKYYRCQITATGLCSGIVSPYTTASAKITVNSSTAISTNPSHQSVCSGSNATFSVAATGANLTYQWQKCSTSIGTFANVTNIVGTTGATSSSLSTLANTANNGYYYKCIVSGSCGTSQTSTAAKLSLNTATSISTQPGNQTVCSGSSATFSIVATGTGTLTYQWQKCSTSTGTFASISGATNASYTFTTAGTDNGYYYKCVVTGTCGSATSNAASLSLNSAPSITAHPAPRSVCAGNIATFSVTATGSGTLSYKWQKSTTSGGTTFADISSATSSTYTFTSASTDNGFNYRCVISGTCTPSVTSNAGKLTINTATSITTNPSNQSVCVGSSTTFTVAATGSGTLYYQWQKCSTSTGTFANISGATSSIYTFATASTDNAYYYKCQVYTSSCSNTVYSNTALLTVSSVANLASTSTVMEGNSATLLVGITGTTSGIQWQRSLTSSGTYANIGGALSALYSFTPTCSDNGYYYRCQVSGSPCGTVYSTPVQLTVQCKISGTVTLTQSDLTSASTSTPAITKFYDRLDYTNLTNSIQTENLNIQLDLGDDYTLGSGQTYNISETVTITPYSSTDVAGTPQTLTLTLDGTSKQTQQLAIFDFTTAFPTTYTTNDYYKIEFYALVSNDPSSSATSQTRVQVWLDEDYNVDVNSGSYTTSPMIFIDPVDTLGNRVTFSWSSNNPAIIHTASYVPEPDATTLVDHYQIQVLRIYNLSETNTDAEYAYNNNIDWSKALSLEVEDATSISLFMAEGTGYYAWRVRPIGDYYDGGIADSRNWGVWSSYKASSISPDDTYTISSTASLPNYLFYITQNDDSKNWIYNRVFTENNRIAEGMNYATGLGQIKQSQRKLAEVDSVLMNAKEYDYVGRPAITSMTAPIDQRDFEYKDQLIKNEAGALYSPTDFDSDARVDDPLYPPQTDDTSTDETDESVNNVPVWENPRKMNGPISDYYSDENPDLNIPNAGNYPYSRTVYDKLGRPKKVSLFGEEHRMGLYDITNIDGGYQRTVRTYYSAVNDTELMGVFGNMTPADSFVYKIIRVDPNEVATVEYISNGKTIATAMIDAADNQLLEDIYTGDTWYTKIISTQTKSDEYSYLKQQEINFSVPGVDVYVDYWLDLKSFSANCVDYCSTCDYQVSIYAIREETNSYVAGMPVTFTINPSEYAGECSGEELTWNLREDRLEGPDNDTTYSFFLSDPGNYIIGRKITVNNKLFNDTTSTRYRDFHSSEISTLLNTEADKFDEMANLVADDEVSGSLNNLYDFIESLPTGSSASCGETSSAAFDASSLSSSDLHSFLGSGFGSSAASSTSSSDIWLVSANTDTNGDTTSYTVASSCLEVEIPKIDCDWNPCDAIWKTSVPIVPIYNYEQDLIDAYDGYYDFESVLYDKYNRAEGSYGNLLYKYFYDESGNNIYSSGTTDTYTITIGSIENGCGGSYYAYSDGIRYPENQVIRQDASPSFVITIDPDGSGDVAPITIYSVSATVYPTLDKYDCTGHGSTASYILNDYVAGIAAYISSTLSTYPDYDYTVTYSTTETGTSGTISISSSFSKALPNASQSISLSDITGLAIPYIGHSTTYPDATDKFLYGNGYVNAMLNHMLHETVKADDGTDTSVYGDCYDMYMVWEGFVNNWESLYLAKGNSTVPGNNFLQVLVDDYGTIYSGFSNHKSGTATLSFPNDASSGDYGYGYLEYAYKSFDLDITNHNLHYSSADPQYKTQIDNCAQTWGVQFFLQPEDWTHPADCSSEETWNRMTCGAAWWDGSAVIADELGEDAQCQAWKNFYGCINSDFELVDGLIFGDETTFTGDVTEGVTGALGDKIIESVGSFLDKRKTGLTSRVTSLDATISPGHAGLYANLLITNMKSNLSLSVQTSTECGSAGLGTTDQIEALKQIMQNTITITKPGESSDANYTPIAAAIHSKGTLLAEWLNNNLCTNSPALITGIQINGAIDNFNTEYGLSGSGKMAHISSSLSFSKRSTATGLDFGYILGSLKINNSTASTTTLLSISTSSTISTQAFAYKFNTTTLNDNLLAIGNPRNNFHFKTCDARNITYVYNAIQDALTEAKDCRLQNSLSEYDTKCTLKRSIKDSLKIRYRIDYHQFTLFYYDMAGNLLKTIPPLGVDTFVYDTDGDGVRDASPSRNDVKHHRMATTYAYNSVGQRIAEETPDGGETQFWYNNLAQLRFSQNAKQAERGKYSYLKYDDLSRIIEAGESTLGGYTTSASAEDETFPTTNCVNTVNTVYDDAVSGLYYTTSTATLSQGYLQNRVSYAYSDPDPASTGDEVKTYYSYDPHGNVEWMLQDIPGLDSKKYIAYEYDLVSGKVTKVKYNEGKADQFFHRYTYDSDSRIEKVETSRDNYIWDTDAKYAYYAYGPLKRLSIGEDHIQGIDYVYTINGWLKGVNHQSLSATYDPGNDGATGSSFPTDVYGNTLGYFEGDFKRKYTSGSTSTYSPFNSEFSDASSPYYNTGVQQMDWYRPDATTRAKSTLTCNPTDNSVDYQGLYNGTITNMVYNTNITGSGAFLNTSIEDKAQGFKFNYDELYRITNANFDYYSGADWYKKNNAAFNAYKSTYAYDINGNITSLSRYEAGSTAIMDNLNYVYNSGNNQLNYIKDLAGLTTNPYDLENQSASNYTYNAMGQLATDRAEGISEIRYTPSGKVDYVTYTSGKQISFVYDAMGYKVARKMYESSTDRFQNVTYYVNDAKGNVMAVYDVNEGNDDMILRLKEFPIYAADKIGEFKPTTPIDSTSTLSGSYTRTVADKYYEIKDHLGNVRAVVSDVKNDDNTAIVKSASDYYPFGMIMPGRDYQSSEYRYGYQGKERLEEMKDGGNAYDFGARILDPRVGRWLSLDPLAAKYPSMSPYNFCANNPIMFVDPDGKEFQYVFANLTDSRSYFESLIEMKREDIYFRQLVATLSQADNTITVGAKINADNDLNALGTFSAGHDLSGNENGGTNGSGAINMKESAGDKAVIGEELFHAYQQYYYGHSATDAANVFRKGNGDTETPGSSISREVEAKVAKAFFTPITDLVSEGDNALVAFAQDNSVIAVFADLKSGKQSSTQNMKGFDMAFATYAKTVSGRYDCGTYGQTDGTDGRYKGAYASNMAFGSINDYVNGDASKGIPAIPTNGDFPYHHLGALLNLIEVTNRGKELKDAPGKLAGDQ